MTLITRDYQNARLVKPNIRIPADKPGIRESYDEFVDWLCAAVCFAGAWVVVWVIWQAWGWAGKLGVVL